MSGLLFIISIILWYLAFISTWFILFILATILLIIAIISLVSGFILIIKSQQTETSKLITQVDQGEKRLVRNVTNSINHSQVNVVDNITNKVSIVTLSGIEWRLINYLRKHNHVKQSDLIEGCDLSKSTVSSNLTSLEGKRIIERRKMGKTKEVILINNPNA